MKVPARSTDIQCTGRIYSAFKSDQPKASVAVLRFFMVPDHLINDEAQEFFAEIGIELSVFGQFPQPLDLAVFTRGVRGGEGVLGLVGTHRLGDTEAFGKDVDQRGIDIVDGGAKRSEGQIGG